LTDLTLHGFKQYGVNVFSCDGSAAQPIVLSDLRITTTDAAQAGLFFTFRNPQVQKTQYFTVASSFVEGPGHKAMTSALDAVSGVKLPDGWAMEKAP
jgi:hypothetical protein